MARDCDIRLTLPASAENVVLVRHVLGALAEALRMPPEAVSDIKLAVTEACTNVVRHAYAGVGGGSLDVIAEPEPDCLTVVVSDHGCGLEPITAGDGGGLGLPLIAALSDRFEIESGPHRGSRLRMFFASAADRFQPA